MPDTAPAATDPSDIDTFLKSRGMATYPEIDKRREELVGQFKGVGETESAAIDRGTAARDKLMAGGIRSPASPRLENIPKAPDQKFQDPMQAFGSPAVFLAALGSLFTRHPLKVALDSATASINAFHAGDKERMEAERERWHEAVETATKQNAVELEKYNAAWKATEHNVAERQARMQAIASGTNDAVMKAAIATGDLDRVWQMLDARQKANDHLQEVLIRERDRKEALDIRRKQVDAQIGASQMTDEAIETGARIYNKTGKFPPNMGRGIQGPANMTKMLNLATQLAQEEGKTPEQVAEMQREFQTRAAGLRALETRRGRLLSSIYSTDEMGDLLKQASAASPRTELTIVNRGLQNIEAQTSDPKLASFVAAINSYANMYAQAIAGGGPPRVSDKEHVYDMLNRAMGTGAIDAVVDQIHKEIRAEMRSTRKALRELSTDEDVNTDDRPGGAQPPAAPAGGAPIRYDAQGNRVQ